MRWLNRLSQRGTNMNKTISATAILAIILWGITALARLTPAQDNTLADNRKSGLTLDDASLQKMLDGLGFEPKKLSKGFLIAVKKEGWTYNIQFVISADRSRLGMNANLGSIEKAEDVTAGQWMNILIATREVDPSAFYFDKDQKKLYLHRVLDNRAIIPAYVREQVDNFCANMKNTSDAWKFTK